MSGDIDIGQMLADMTAGAPTSELLKMNEIQHLMIMIFDWRRSYAENLVGRKNRLFQVILASIQHKEGVKSVQEYFGGKRISRFANTIDDWMANEYVGYLMEELQRMMDPRVRPTRIK